MKKLFEVKGKFFLMEGESFSIGEIQFKSDELKTTYMLTINMSSSGDLRYFLDPNRDRFPIDSEKNDNKKILFKKGFKFPKNISQVKTWDNLVNVIKKGLDGPRFLEDVELEDINWVLKQK